MRIERFDLAAVVAVIVLIVAIGAVIVGGDHAGVGIVSQSPQGSTYSKSPVRITFAEAMNTASVVGTMTSAERWFGLDHRD